MSLRGEQVQSKVQGRGRGQIDCPTDEVRREMHRGPSLSSLIKGSPRCVFSAPYRTTVIHTAICSRLFAKKRERSASMLLSCVLCKQTFRSYAEKANFQVLRTL